MSAHDCGGDAAAYALGALDRDEEEAFRVHLESCVVCRDELAAFGQVVEQLPMAAPPHAAPRRLRRRVRRALREQQVPRRRSLPRPAVAAATAVVAAAALVGGIELGSSSPGHARVIQASVIDTRGQAQLRLNGNSAELFVSNFPAPPKGKIYEVWLQRASSAPSPTGALFSVTSSGAGDVGVPGSLRGVDEILVTPEPAGGSPSPTHAPVIVARLT